MSLFPTALDNLITNLVADSPMAGHSAQHDSHASAINAMQSALLSGMPLLDKGGSVFNVRAYGATGNGVTDDIVALEAARDAAALASPYGRATIYFPRGYYAVSRKFVVDNDYAVLTGEGALSSFIMLMPGVANVEAVLHIGSSRMVATPTINNLGIEGGADKGHAGGHGIEINANQPILSHVFVNNAPQAGIYFNASSTAFSIDASTVYINVPGTYGIFVNSNNYDAVFTNALIRGGVSIAAKGGSAGIYNQGTESHFKDCHPFFVNGHGLYGDSGSVQVIGGEYESNANGGINLTTQTAPWAVIGCTGFYQNGFDLLANQTNSVWGGQVIGNTFRSVCARNLWFDNISHVSLMGNTFIAFTTEAVQFAGGCSGFSVVGNTMATSSATAFFNVNGIADSSFMGNVGNKAIVETNLSARNLFIGNNLHGAGITVAGSGSSAPAGTNL
jgi:hypothetical protein